MRPSNGITFEAILAKASTLVDGGWRVSFDLPESAAKSVLQLSQMRAAVLSVGVIPLENPHQDPYEDGLPPEIMNAGTLE